jgi:anti-sigma regulatory factor (Ser/Thr protein kinase)
MMFCQLAIPISDSSQIGESRRQTQRIAAEIGLSESDCGKASIVATELATNISRYATSGEVLLRSLTMNGVPSVEILAVDRGPGMANVANCLQDGQSSGGTAGQGLGAVQRLSTEFDIFSSPGGTIVLSRIQANPKPAYCKPEFIWGAVNRPAPKEIFSGDTWRIAQRESELMLLIADGLGHGPQAAEAADTAAATFDENPFLPLTEYFTAANRRMRGTRGAAMAVARINRAQAKLEYVGVGNIAGSLRSPPMNGGRGLVSHNGTVGAEMRKVASYDYFCSGPSLLIMHSDGLQSRWSLDTYPGLALRHPAIVATVLYRDFVRGHDDVTVVVVRFSSGSHEKNLVA